jgi:hypothetical protein
VRHTTTPPPHCPTPSVFCWPLRRKALRLVCESFVFFVEEGTVFAPNPRLPPSQHHRASNARARARCVALQLSLRVLFLVSPAFFGPRAKPPSLTPHITTKPPPPVTITPETSVFVPNAAAPHHPSARAPLSQSVFSPPFTSEDEEVFALHSRRIHILFSKRALGALQQPFPPCLLLMRA